MRRAGSGGAGALHEFFIDVHAAARRAHIACAPRLL
jgi:hypothetical protein